MSESLDRRILPQDNPESEKQREQKESERYLKLARENPHTLTEEIKKNPKTEPLLRKILWDTEYERVRDLNPIKLSEDSSIAKMQKEIYSFVDINPDTDRNGTKEKFIKWLIDSIIIENSELAMKIIETKWAILKDMLAQIFSWEWLKQIAEWLGKSVMGVFSGDAYKTGKSLWELGLITVWSGAGGFVLKRVWKWAIQAGERVAVNAGKETVVSQWLQIWGRATEWVGKVVQAPYNAVEAGVKKVWWAIKDGVRTGSEALWNIPQVQKITERARKVVSEWIEKLSDGTRKVITATKERAKEALALASVPILVGSKDGVEASGKLRGQLGAVGDLSIESLKAEQRRKISDGLYKWHSFLDTPANREFLWELSPERILGEGMNGIVITHNTREWAVVKISHPQAIHDLGVEASNHNTAFQLLRSWKKEWAIPDTVKIPTIIEHFSETKGYYIMEWIKGQSLHSKFLRETFANYLQKDSKELLDSLTDNQLKRRLIDTHRVPAEFIDLAIENNSAEFTRNYLASRADYQQAKEYMKERWFTHPDLHWWNIMLDNNWNLYIIDFWDKPKP